MFAKGTRYESKPFLRLLELYVLWCIDGLTDTDERTLIDLTPKLQKTYGRHGRWYEIVEEEMAFPMSIRVDIECSWVKNRQIAFDAGQDLRPEQFAELFVDANFFKSDDDS